ncbi:MAG: chromosomal replication initiator protein DnaA [Clostridiales bacterium]|nr:chromosomal replication initiator protein DnaA [Clostridiales bacterium]
MENIRGLWQEASEYLKQKISPISYNNWFANLVPARTENNKLLLIAETDLAKKTLTNMYTETVAEALNAVGARGLTVAFITESESIDETPIENGTTPPMLNPKYTFDTFVVGESNKFAHAACTAVASKPAMTYNPLFIYGGVGLGKTHLMHAGGHAIYESNPKLKVLYVTSETFTNEMIQSVRDNSNAEFRKKYRDIDVLMVDDVQFLAGKTSTQSEFFHTFNTLFVADKQIILTSDRPPKEIPTLDARMYTRFECGLVADINSPDFETRAAILRKRADMDHIVVSNDVINYIAEKVQSNIRELEGAFTRVVAYSQLSGDKITNTLVDKVLTDLLQRSVSRRITPEIILQVVSDYYQYSVDDLTGKKRDKRVSNARQLCMYMCRKILDLSFENIGTAIGGKHYTTVMYACEKISEELEKNARGEMKIAIEDIEARLQL